MSDLAVHIWRGSADETPPNLFRLEFQQLGKDDSFFFDLTPESLNRMVETLITFASESTPGSYGQFCFDLSEEGDIG